MLLVPDLVFWLIVSLSWARKKMTAAACKYMLLTIIYSALSVCERMLLRLVIAGS